ncbi:hypothetical protein ACP4OV_027823 [Aristida adscensionis]
MARNTERAMLGCFPAARRPTSPSMYEEGSTSAASTSLGTVSPPSSASTSSPAFPDDDALYPNPDAEPDQLPDAAGLSLSTAIASHRFFLSSPGRSNSIVDSAEHAAAPHGRPRVLQGAGTTNACSTSAATSSAAAREPLFRAARDDMQPVRKVSVSTDAPRADFLKSMLEMVEALGLEPRRDADLARLHDLLLCYITLNEPDALRDILGAFTDLMCILEGNNASATPAAGKTREAGAFDQMGR